MVVRPYLQNVTRGEKRKKDYTDTVTNDREWLSVKNPALVSQTERDRLYSKTPQFMSPETADREAK